MKKNARIYLRVSTEQQSLERQERIIQETKDKGFYIAGVYAEKSTGTTSNRTELQRMISDIQPGDYIIAESIDRITRLLPEKAEELINQIENKGAKLLVPGYFYFDDILSPINNDLPSQYPLEPFIQGLQKMFLRFALQTSYDDWKIRQERTRQGIKIAKEKGRFKGRPKNEELHKAIIKLRKSGITIVQTAKVLNTSTATVNRVWANRKRMDQKLLQ